MARSGDRDEVAPPPPPPPLDTRQPMEEAAAGKLARSEHHHCVTDARSSPPSFRMEDLPAEIQPIIISMLPLKEVVRACIVSTSWRMLWRFHCNLCFDGLTDANCDTNDEFKDSTKIELAKFIETINWVIQQHSGIGINKFSIRCGLHKEDSDHLDRWIEFAATSKAKIIAFAMVVIDCPFEVHHFPLEALHAEGSSFVRSLSLTGVSTKPHSGICGFTVLKRLVLEYVEIFGDFSGFLANCPALEDLEMIKCSGVTNLSIPHQLDKLQHLLIKKMDVEAIESRAADLAHFEYKGKEIPIILNGRSKLEKATIMFEGSNGLARVFTTVPIILRVKMLNVQARISAYEQLQKLTLRPDHMFIHLRHMTCQLTVMSLNIPNSDNGVLQLAHCLDVAPQLETLHLDMKYSHSMVWVHDDLVEEEGPHMRRHDHLKTIDISGFRCYAAQSKLACCILENACVLEHMRIQPRISTRIWRYAILSNIGVRGRFLPVVHEWAQLTSERFGKAITVLDDPSE